MYNKEVLEKQKLLNPNDNKFSWTISFLQSQTNKNQEIISVSLKDLNLSQQEKTNLLEWYQYFGDKRYLYTLNENQDYCSLRGVLKK